MNITGADKKYDWTWEALHKGRVARIDGGYHHGKLVLKVADDKGFILEERYEDDQTLIALFKPFQELSATFSAELRLG